MAKAGAKQKEKNKNIPPEPASEALTAGDESAKGKNKKRRKAGKKRNKKLLIIMTVILLILAIIVAGIAAIYFNLFGARDKFIEFATKLDPSYAASLRSTEKLNERELKLNETSKQLKEEEERLNGIRIDLEKREAEMLTSGKSTTPKYRQSLTEEQIDDLKNASKIYAAMNAEEAAKVLSLLYEIEDMATIIYYMNTSAAAKIMENMDQRLAAQITEELLDN